MQSNSYTQINEYRINQLETASLDSEKINKVHDLIYKSVIAAAIQEVIFRHGNPPSPFTFFVMGSAGRSEQSIWSDQDHGLVFEAANREAQEYFIELGNEIVNGLEVAGYKKCSGSVMANNPHWCKSSADWQLQIDYWADDSTWESIRYLLIFADARALYGDLNLLSTLKERTFESVNRENLLLRMLENTMHLKKGVGILGQLLPETHGSFSGSVNLKETAFLPFVNAARLLAFYEGIQETSTLSRLSLLPDNIMLPDEKSFYKHHFSSLLHFRLEHGFHKDYDAGHYVSADELNKKEIKVLKEILKAGKQLYEKARKVIERM